MTWHMPPEVIAQFGLFQYASTAFLIIVTCGLDQAFLRELATQRVPSGLLRNSLLPSLGMMFILSTLIFIWARSDNATDIFGRNAQWLISLLLINVFFLILHRFGGQQTRMKENGGLAYFLAEIVLRFPLIIFLCILIIEPYEGVESIPFVAVVTGAALSAMVLIASNYKTWAGIFTNPTESSKSIVDLYKFGIPLALAGLLYWGIGNTGVFLTQKFHATEVTARLVVATSIANIATIVQAIFSLVWLPIVYRKIDNGLLPEEVSRIGRAICFVATLFFIGVVFALYFVQLFLGGQYRDIAQLATALCVLPILYTISEVTFVGLMMIRKSGAALFATAIGLSGSILANALLTPNLGASGAVTAVAIAAMLFLVGRTEMSAKYWFSFDRRNIYFGASSIMLAGIITTWLPTSLGPISLVILIPYLWIERRLGLELVKLNNGALSWIK
jgi:O-antigen/teichoic acid export membrane protein